MMPTDRFERHLPAILDEISQPHTPDYFDDLLGLTARTRQRPAWTLLERWLPVVDIARQPAFVRQVPWRPIAAATLILLLLIASLAFVIGSQRRVPAPFGQARNGLVAYVKDGDIYTADPATGTSVAVVTGPAIDLRPVWSRDGTRFVFERKQLDDEASPGQLVVANADGTRLTTVTPEPIAGIAGYAFSPDGTEILVVGPEPIGELFIAKVDGSGIRRLDPGLPVSLASWRPPDGAEILFRGGLLLDDVSQGLYAVDVDSGTVRTIREPAPGRHPTEALWSPDGSHIAYYEWVESGSGRPISHVVAADGSGDRPSPTHPGAVWEAPDAWSNDGSWLISRRGYTDDFEDVRVVIVPADGSSLGVETDVPGAIDGGCCTSWEWAPDDTSVLGNPADASGRAMPQVLLDPLTGKSRTMPWTTSSSPAWQRLAP